MIFGIQTHAFEDTVVKENHKKSWSLRSQQISALSCTGMTDPSFLQVVLEKVHQKLPNFVFDPQNVNLHLCSLYVGHRKALLWNRCSTRNFVCILGNMNDLTIPSIWIRRISGRVKYNNLSISLPLLGSHYYHHHTQGWKSATFLVLFCAAFIVWTVQHHFLMLGNHIFDHHNLKLITAWPKVLTL